MVIKNKGNKTKDKILFYAKQEFYQNGYHHATVQTIAKNANISLGNLNYYFSKKDDIVKEIYDQFIINIYKFIDSTGNYGPLEKYCYFTFIIYSIILSDEHNKKFYYEVILNKSNYRIIHDLMTEYYQNIIYEQNLMLKYKDFEIFVLTEFGSRHELFLAYLEGHLNITFNELIFYILKNMCKNLEIENSIIENLIDLAFVFTSKNDYSKIKFLIPASPVFPTDALHEKFGFRTDYQIVSNKQMKKNLKTKK